MLSVTIFVAIVVFRILYVVACAFFFVVKKRQQDTAPYKYSLPPVDLYLVLGGCGPRECEAVKQVAMTPLPVSSSGSAECGRRREVWVLAPARKKISWYQDLIALDDLRIKNLSVCSVTNCTQHAAEIAVACGPLGEVTIFTCPQHVKRAAAIASVVLVPLGVFPKVVSAFPNSTVVCENCVGKAQNGQESMLRTARDVGRAVMWTLFRIDFFMISDWFHRSRSASKEERCRLAF